MQALLEGGTPDFPVLLEVWKVRSQKEAVALFVEINRSESVQEIDLPDELGVHSEIKVTIDGAVSELKVQFPKMFKPSQNCRVPHLNEELLRNELFQQRAPLELGCAGDLFLLLASLFLRSLVGFDFILCKRPTNTGVLSN
jgi:hypothetical protein